MSQHNNFYAEALVDWISPCSEKQLRFITYGLLNAILIGKEKLVRNEESAECLTILTNGLLFAALVKENYNEEASLGTWLTKTIDQQALQDTIKFFHLHPDDIL